MAGLIGVGNGSTLMMALQSRPELGTRSVVDVVCMYGRFSLYIYIYIFLFIDSKKIAK